jgi:hypothetical protein
MSKNIRCKNSGGCFFYLKRALLKRKLARSIATNYYGKKHASTKSLSQDALMLPKASLVHIGDWNFL